MCFVYATEYKKNHVINKRPAANMAPDGTCAPSEWEKQVNSGKITTF